MSAVEIKIVTLSVSDLEKIANKTPITGCNYITPATSVDVNFVNAYPFKK